MSLLRTVVVVVLLGLAVPGCTTPQGPRAIEIVARGMTFTLPSDPDTANPVIRRNANDCRMRAVTRELSRKCRDDRITEKRWCVLAPHRRGNRE